MSQLETAMGMTIAVFDQYARTDGNRQTLSKAELKTLLEKELPNFLEVCTAVSCFMLKLQLRKSLWVISTKKPSFWEGQECY
ncbi:protein S100-P isoform X3 [Haemorhous mexicanus]|uniref:protein S100-P isoform X3 n=1 Tax=Haemorhous mexicanus TaxID=30427 RepID=UPI0028BEDDD2|nr:protein S100-P isoform X3 [Haemorhous mexicanus]